MKRNESLWSLLGLDTDSGADVLAFPFYDQRLPKLENFFANPYVGHHTTTTRRPDRPQKP